MTPSHAYYSGNYRYRENAIHACLMLSWWCGRRILLVVFLVQLVSVLASAVESSSHVLLCRIECKIGKLLTHIIGGVRYYCQRKERSQAREPKQICIIGYTDAAPADRNWIKPVLEHKWIMIVAEARLVHRSTKLWRMKFFVLARNHTHFKCKIYRLHIYECLSIFTRNCKQYSGFPPDIAVSS